MNTDRPWWFSGDEPESSTHASEHSGPERSEEADAASAGKSTDSESTDTEQPDRGDPGIAEVIAGVGTLVSWARERVIDPHLQHEDPAAHPDCVICRGMAAVSRLSDFAPIDIEIADEAADTADNDITWLPLTRRGSRQGKAKA